MKKETRRSERTENPRAGGSDSNMEKGHERADGGADSIATRSLLHACISGQSQLIQATEKCQVTKISKSVNLACTRPHPSLRGPLLEVESCGLPVMSPALGMFIVWTTQPASGEQVCVTSVPFSSQNMENFSLLSISGTRISSPALSTLPDFMSSRATSLPGKLWCPWAPRNVAL